MFKRDTLKSKNTKILRIILTTVEMPIRSCKQINGRSRPTKYRLPHKKRAFDPKNRYYTYQKEENKLWIEIPSELLCRADHGFGCESNGSAVIHKG